MALIYFDIFNYPLTLNEIARHSTISTFSETELLKELEALQQRKIIHTSQNFFFLPQKEYTVDRRIPGNKKADLYIKKARKISKFISYFPFIEGIFLSGSISKGFADHDSDIDYFIVTSPGRLWLSRTMLILFKKLFLFNSKKYFCLNYFIDSNHLEIPDKNIFTAIELKYLLPTYNERIYQNILKSNHWANEYLPNFKLENPNILPERKVFIRKVLEKALGGYIGNILDDLCLKSTERFWKYKFRKKADQSGISIHCKKHVSKFHPQSFQNKVLEKYENKISEFEKIHQLRLCS